MVQRLCVAIGILLGGVVSFPYTVDDAYIVGRYARHLAGGLGYVMNPQGPMSDGVTGPLWLLPGLLGPWLSVDPVFLAKVVGLLCAMIAGVVCIGDVSRRQRAPLAAWFAAVTLALQPSYATWAVAGLETGAAAMALAFTARGRVGDGTRSLGLYRGLWAGSLAWLRPELVPVGLVLLVAQRRRIHLASALVAAFALLLAVLAFRFALFGNAWPLSARAKPSSISDGLDYVLRAVVIITGLFGFVAAWLAARWGRSEERVLALALATGLVCIAVAGGDWMPGFRLFAPLLPLYAALVGQGVAGVKLRRGWLWALGLLVMLLALPAVDFTLRIPALRDSARSREQAGQQIAAAVARQGGRLAMVDVGYIPYMSGIAVADLGGVTDADVGDLPGAHLDKHIDAMLVRRWQPTQLLLHSDTRPEILVDGRLRGWRGYPVERRLAQLPYVQQNFRAVAVFAYGPAYHYVWLVREEVEAGALGD